MKSSVMTYVHPGNVSKKFPSSRWNGSEIRGIATETRLAGMLRMLIVDETTSV